MKKSLLFAAATVVTLSAMAAPQQFAHKQKSQMERTLSISLFQKPDMQKVETSSQQIHKAKSAEEGPVMSEFPGKPSVYSMDGYPDGYYDYDLPVLGLLEDNQAYFSGLLPGSFNETVVIQANREGDRITIPAQKIYSQYFLFDYYICDMFVGTLDGQTGEMTDEPFELIINEDGSITGTDQFFLGLFADVSDYGYTDRELITYNIAFNLVPFECNDVVEIPEDAQPVDYVCKYGLGNGIYSDMVQVYVDGSDFYTNGFSSGYYTWVKGTIADGKVTIPSGQFMGTNAAYILNMIGITNLELDASGYPVSYDRLPELTFTVTEDGYVLDEGQVIALEYGSGEELFTYMKDVELALYKGDVIAKPVTPVFQEFAGFFDDYGQYAFRAYFPAVGTNGEFLRHANMEWAIYGDEFIYTFSPDDGYLLDEDMEWFPADNFTDNDSWDIICANGDLTMYMYEGLFFEIGLQSRNTVDGVTLYSDIIYINPIANEEGLYETHVVEVENEIPVGITDVEKVKVTSLFDLQGRRAEKQSKGLLISDGKVCFKK